jgi:hypothetical protein
MRQKSVTRKEPAEKVVKDIRRATRKRHSAHSGAGLPPPLPPPLRSFAGRVFAAAAFPFPPMRFDWVVQTKAHLQMMNC